jgi:hypothetical protein
MEIHNYRHSLGWDLNKELEISEDRIGELFQPRIHGHILPVIKKDLYTGGSRL